MIYRRTGFAAIFSLIAFFFISPEIVLCQQYPSASEQGGDALQMLEKGVERLTLSNGLRVVVYRRAGVPVFSGQIWVKVGGVNEVAGKTGISHMLEHMAFKGSEVIGSKDFKKEKPLLDELDRLMSGQDDTLEGEARQKRIAELEKELDELSDGNEFSRLYERRGAVGLNAGTAKDFTFYMVSLPTNEFEFWCWMESDRLLAPVFRQFYKEREVVLEERRMRVDDDPGGKLYETLLDIAYKVHPNRLPVIGWADNVRNLQAHELKALYRTYYRPDNMVLSLVGDIELESAEPLLEKYFGRIPRAVGEIPQVSVVEPAQIAERAAVVQFDAEPSLIMGYHKPVYPNADDMYFSILHGVLSDGRSSILQRELVEEKHLAAAIETSEAPGELYPSLFIVAATPVAGVTTERLRDEIQLILDRLASKPLPEKLIAEAKKRVRVGLLSGMRSNYGLSKMLGKTELFYGDWSEIVRMYKIVESTTPENVREIAAKYLRPENRTYVRTVRPLKAKLEEKK
ncbi:MAG: insulinase family protein [bacterium]|nr:insulinase family protein [bacterium]